VSNRTVTDAGGGADSHRDTAVDFTFKAWLQDFTLIPTHIHLLRDFDRGETITERQL
jgi:hypothetical protein